MKTTSHRLLCSLILCMVLPVKAAEVLEHEDYDQHYCATCHGSEGSGNEAVDAPRIAGMERWYLERQMELFRDGLRGTHPEDEAGMEMQAVAAVLDDEQLSEILDRVESWPYEPAEVTLDGNVRNGRSLYRSCATCHGSEAEGNEAMNAPALAGQNDWYLLRQLANFKAGYRGYDTRDTHGNQMRMMAQTLRNEQAMRDVVSYINTLGR